MLHQNTPLPPIAPLPRPPGTGQTTRIAIMALDLMRATEE